MNIYNKILKHKEDQEKTFAILLDPDKTSQSKLDNVIKNSIDAHVDYLFVGGSLMMNSDLDNYILRIKAQCNIPIVLFPGNTHQLSPHADALLYLSMISGRNPELLIGKHVESAAFVKASGLEILPTGYILIDGGLRTSVEYMSNTRPIPHDKNNIAISTAMAGEMLGLKLIYLEAGSGAHHTVSNSMITKVQKNINIPMIVGGGIKTPESAKSSAESGADIIVVGNAIEYNSQLIKELSIAIHSAQTRHTKL